MSSAELQTFVSVIRDNRLLDQSELTHLDVLQSRCSGPSEVAKELLERGSLTRYQAELIFQGEGNKLVLGQYILLEPIGEGGMGMVYKAKHRRMKRIVALKVIRKDVAAGSTALARFNQEIEAAAQLVHANVVVAYDANEVDDTLFFVMEYVEGIDLGKLVQRFGKVPLANAADFICQAARGLQHAHERGMVHRDIKPSNLLLSFSDSVVKILDMGLARLRDKDGDENRHLTFTGMVMGTPDFISPEQAKDSRLADIRSDLYSLGCAFYYLLAAQTPYSEGSFTEKLLKHTLEEPTPLIEVCPGLPDEVVAIVKKLMAKKPAERYQVPAEMVQELEKYATPEKSAERYRPPKDKEEDVQWTGRVVSQTDVTMEKLPPGMESKFNKMAAPPVADSGTGVLPSAAPRVPVKSSEWDTLPPAAKNSLKEPAAEPQVKPAPAKPDERRSEPKAAFVRGGVAMVLGVGLALLAVLAWKLSGGSLGPHVVVATPTANGETSLNIRPSGSAVGGSERTTKPDTKVTVPETKPVPPTAKEVPVKVEPPVGVIVQLPKRDLKTKSDPLRAAFSRGGRWLIAGWTDNQWTWNLDKPKPNGSADHYLQDYPVYSVAAAPDGRYLLGTYEDILEKGKVAKPVNLVALWDPDSAEKVRVFPGHDKEITAVAFSPQGNRAISGSEDRTVRLWDLRSGKEMQVMRKHEGKVTSVAMSPDGNLGLSGGRDFKVILWDLVTGKDLATLDGHSSIVTTVAFSPDGKYALSAGYDKKIILWDVAKRKQERVYTGHDDVVWSLAFSPDGKYFVSGAADSMVRLWNVDAVEYIREFTEHKSAVIGVAFAEDGRFVLSVSNDHAVRRWDVRKDVKAATKD